MKHMDATFKEQTDFFKQGETRSIDFRLQALTKLKQAIKTHEASIIAARPMPKRC